MRDRITQSTSPTQTVNAGSELHDDQRGATMLEYTLLLAAIGLPSYFLLMRGLDVLIGYYQMNTTINALPFP